MWGSCAVSWQTITCFWFDVVEFFDAVKFYGALG